jgi:hypothetical protein
VAQLRKLGYKAEVANNGAEAFEISGRLEFDVILGYSRIFMAKSTRMWGENVGDFERKEKSF